MITPKNAQAILRRCAGLEPGGLQSSTEYEIKYLVEKAEAQLSRHHLSVWREIILLRDVRCVMCDDDRNLEAHHCQPKSMFPEVAYDPSNGVMLCFRCHRVIVHGSNMWDLTSWQRFTPLWKSLQL